MKRDFGIPACGAGVFERPAAWQVIHWRSRLSGFISLVRPLFFILTPVNAASAAVLANGSYPALAKCLLGFLAVAFASCAVNVFNDFVDRNRDKAIWPKRAIPSGRVRPGEALILAVFAASLSLLITWLTFNPLTFSILFTALVTGGLYSAFWRDRVGYLALPPVVGLIYLGGWAAFSPETLFGSILPWYLYLLGVVWQTAHIMIYYPLHVTPWQKAPPALFFRPSPKIAVLIGFVFTGITLVMAGMLPVLVPALGLPYLVIVAPVGLWAVYASCRLLGSVTERKKNLQAFFASTIFRLAISGAILSSLLWL